MLIWFGTFHHRVKKRYRSLTSGEKVFFRDFHNIDATKKLRFVSLPHAPKKNHSIENLIFGSVKWIGQVLVFVWFHLKWNDFYEKFYDIFTSFAASEYFNA